MVRLKLSQYQKLTEGFIGFNSTMVRLKQGKLGFDISVSSTFQFHNGSIKTYLNYLLYQLHLLFQFHNGSIKTRLIGIICHGMEYVSIPQWFD